MKGYVQETVGIAAIILLMIGASYYYGQRISTEKKVSDRIAATYEIINSVEFAKMNAEQSMKFAVEKTKKDLGIKTLADASLRKSILETLKKNLDLSYPYASPDTEVRVDLVSLNFENNKIMVKINIIATSTTSPAFVQSYYTVSYPLDTNV